MASPPGLEDGRRYRCAGCGNLTRFDVETRERVRRFWHLDLAGQGRIEEEDVAERDVIAVTCRWCNTSDRVEVVAVPGTGDVP